MADRTSAESPAAKGPESAKRRSRAIAAASALGGMIVGSVVGAVQIGVESTGLLGPSVDSLIAEQEANFTGISERLDALQNVSSDPEVRVHLTELRNLVQRQTELSSQAGTELRYLGEQVVTLKSQQLADNAFAGGADFWLDAGEGVNVGDESQVFAVLRLWPSNRAADVNLSGTRQRMGVGDTMAVPGGSCTIFYKQGTPRADGRIGFDINCS